MPLVHVMTFLISKPFPEWVKIYDASIPAQKAAGITSLFRGVSLEDASKCSCCLVAEPGVCEGFIKDNEELIKSSGHVLESTVIATYSQE